MDEKFLESLGLQPEVTESVLAAHKQVLDRMYLEHQVELAIGAAGGKNSKAIGALLDMEALAQAEDIRAAALQAVETVKQENGYLFESRQIPKFAQGTGRAAPGGSSEPTTLAGALRARMKR